MKRYRVRPSGPLKGRVRVPGDKSIGHRALMFGALAEGECTIRGLSGGLDNRATARAFESMGVSVELTETAARVRGVGLRGLRMASGPIDCGNSGTTMRLLAGLLAGQRFGTRLVGDASLTRRPMARVVRPLRARGGHIAGSSGGGAPVADPDERTEHYPPLSIAPLVEGEHLVGLEYELPQASAQVKSALLLSGLYADGLTALREPVVSRDHTERMMVALGVPLETAGPMVVLDPGEWSGRWGGFDWEVPGDPSSAAFLVAAAQLVDGSDLRVEGVGINPTRTGLLDALRPMGAGVEAVPKGHRASDEPVGDLWVVHRRMRGGLVGGELLVRMIDEVPALCAMAAVATSPTEVTDGAELRVKESDRIAAVARMLRAFGAECDEREDGLRVAGGARLRAAHLDSGGDHRIAMAATVLGLAADGETVVDDVQCVETSFPGFADTLRQLGADVRVETGGDG